MGLCNGVSSSKRKVSQTEKKFAKQDITKFYRFGKTLGKGSFGTVRLAYHILEEKNGQQSKAFAIKSINKVNPIIVSQLKVGDQFYLLQRELDILTQLDHPNIIRVYETYEDEKNYHFVMEHCSGGEIFARITNQGVFNENQAAQIMQKLFSAIEYVHQQGIAHRDMKPENLLLSSEDTFDVKIIDFGLSKKYKDKTRKEQHGQVGTPLYIAPEVLEGGFSLDCDTWSLGCIMYVLLCGNTPFYSQEQTMLTAMIRHSTVQFEEKEWKNVSNDAKSLIMGLLTKDPKKRTTCLQAIKSPWIKKNCPNQSRKYQTLASSVNISGEGAPTLLLLNNYANASIFKKEILRIMLNQLREEEIKNLRQQFENLDGDGNGVISADELQQVVGFQGTKKDAETLLKKLIQSNINETSEDLHIKYSEFMAATLNSKQYLNKQRLWCLFKQFDLTGKGYFELSDLKLTIEREGRSLADNKLQEIFSEINVKNTGKVLFKDFADIMTSDLKMEVIIDEMEIDKNYQLQRSIVANVEFD